MSIKKISIYRYDPEANDKPKMVDYQVDTESFQGKMLLDAIEKIREDDPSVGIRRSCGEGVCGSDGMNINGKNGLACVTKLSDLPKHTVLRPLPGFPVIKDLVVDMTQFYKQYYRVDPYLKNTDEEPTHERLQSPEMRAKLDGLYECILCACCTSSCPSYWWNPDKFVGPAGLLAANRFLVDSRDTQKTERLSKLGDPYSVYRCRSIMNCVDACPKDLNPTKAISNIRSMLVDESS